MSERSRVGPEMRLSKLDADERDERENALVARRAGAVMKTVKREEGWTGGVCGAGEENDWGVEWSPLID